MGRVQIEKEKREKEKAKQQQIRQKMLREHYESNDDSNDNDKLKAKTTKKQRKKPPVLSNRMLIPSNADNKAMSKPNKPLNIAQRNLMKDETYNRKMRGRARGRAPMPSSDVRTQQVAAPLIVSRGR